VEACRGISDACRAFGTPVTGGNVSLYNQSPLGAIDPTPTVGMIGLLADVSKAVPSHFQSTGDAILLLRRTEGHLGGSAYWAEVLGTVAGSPPPIDLKAEKALQDFLVEAADRRLLRSAHDLSDGGLAVALAECCMGGPWATQVFGARIDLARHADEVSDIGWLFGEDGASALVSCSPEHVAELQRRGAELGVHCHFVGLVGPAEGNIEIVRDDRSWQWGARRLREIYMNAIPRRMSEAFIEGEG
jgi:phosphoribosylformylglycinamidine synthase